jgi:hypothetical protein
MRTLRIAAAIAVLVFLILGCDNSQSARFANIDGLAGGYDKYEQGGLFCVLGYAKKCKDAEKPDALKEFPFVCKLFNTRKCQGASIYLASKIDIFPEEVGKHIAICGEWIRTPGLNYLLHK